MQELLSIMESMARFLASGEGFTQVNFIMFGLQLIEASTSRDGLTFAAYIGTEDVFPHIDLQALVPGLRLDGALRSSH